MWLVLSTVNSLNKGGRLRAVEVHLLRSRYQSKSMFANGTFVSAAVSIAESSSAAAAAAAAAEGDPILTDKRKTRLTRQQ